MTSLRQRIPRQKDPAHLAFVRAQPCAGAKGCPRPSEAAHLRMKCDALGKRETGMQEKPDDKWSNPLCGYHHRTGVLAQHKMSEADFWKLRGIDPFAMAMKLFVASGGAARAAEPQPVKKLRKIKARKPSAQRKKLKAGRKLQSNPVIQSRGFGPQHRPFASRASERRT